MSGSLGSLSVEIELTDQGFTTTVSRVGTALRGLERDMLQVVAGNSRVESALSSSAGHFAAWSVAIGESGAALHNLQHFTLGWLESMVRVNSEIERSTILLEGLSSKMTDIGRMADAQAGMKSLLQMAGNTPFSLGALTDTFVKMRTAGLDPLNGSLKALTDAIAYFGGDDQRLKRAGYAIQEMAGRGVLSLQNLRRQLGQDIPGALEAMASAANLTVGQLTAAVQKGTVEARSAIQLMLDQLARMHGGAAERMVTTFTGRVQQLSTSMKELALIAGGQLNPALDKLANAGTGGGTGFYAQLTQAMGQLNQVLSSPQMQANAISLNLNLQSLLQTGVRFVELLIRWQGPLTRIAELFAVLAGARAVAGLTSALTTFTTGTLVQAYQGMKNLRDAALSVVEVLPTLARGALQIGSILNSFGYSAINATKQLGALMAERMMLVENGGSFLAKTMPLANPVVERVTGEGLGLGAIFADATANAVGLGAALAAVAIPAAVIVGAGLLGSKLLDDKVHADDLADALKRVKLGDITSDNAKGALDELNAGMEKLKAAQEAIAHLEHKRATGGRFVFGEPRLGAFGSVPAVESLSAMFSGESSATHYLNQAKNYQKNLASELGSDRAFLAKVPMMRMMRDAEQHAQMLMDRIRTEQNAATVQFEEASAKIDQRRSDFAKTNPSGSQDQFLQQTIQATQAWGQQRLAIVNSYIKKEEDALRQASAAKNQIAQADATASLQMLRREQSDEQQMVKGQVDRLKQGLTFTGGAKDAATQARQGQTLLQSLQARLDGLNATLAEGQPIAARYISEIVKGGHLELMPVGEKMRVVALVNDLDAAATAVKHFAAAKKLEANIDAGFSRQASELQNYIAKLADPNLTEAQRGVIAFQAQMTDLLKRLGVELGTSSAEFKSWSKTVASAIADAQANAALNEGAAFHQSATRLDVQAAPPGHERAQTQISQAQQKAADILRGYSQALAGHAITLAQYDAAVKQTLGDVGRMEKDYQAIAGRSDAKAARPGETAVTDLAAKLAGLKSEIQGTNRTYAEWATRVADNSVYSVAGDKIKSLAAQVTFYEGALKKARSAEQAFNTLADNANSAKDRLQLVQAIDQETAHRGQLLGIERQILEYRLRQDALARKVANQTPTAAKSQSTINSEATQAQQQATDNTHAFALSGLLEQLDQMRQQTDQLRMGNPLLSHVARSAAANDQLSNEQSRLSQLIAMYAQNDTQRKQMEDTLDNYIQAKRDQLNRKTEDGLMKMSDNYGNVDAHIASFGQGLMSKFTDTMAQGLTTTKANWQSFTSFILSQLERIAIEMAMSPLLKLADNAWTGSGTGGNMFGTSGLSGLLGGLFSSMFGGAGAASSGSNAAVAALGSGYTGPAFHTGGIVGAGEHSFVKGIGTKLWHRHPFSPHKGNGLPKFHTGGLALNEQLAILQHGEGVFTTGQMAAIGNVTRSSTMMSQAMGAIASALRPPMTVGGAFSPGKPGMGAPNVHPGSGGVGNLSVHMHNQTGMHMGATAAPPRFDGEQWVLDLVIKHAQQPGPLRNALRQVQ